MRVRSKRLGRAGFLVGVVALVLWIPAASNASLSDLLALLRSTPSDSRAVFHDGNVVTCSGRGFPARPRWARRKTTTRVTPMWRAWWPPTVGRSNPVRVKK